MMLVTVSVQGEPDTKPFTKVFEYATGHDELVFLESVKMVRKRVSEGLRININEALVLFVDLIVRDLTAGKEVREIQEHAAGLLLPEEVLIGVAEGLQNMTFVVCLDDSLQQKIVLDTPIPICAYMMSGKA